MATFTKQYTVFTVFSFCYCSILTTTTSACNEIFSIFADAVFNFLLICFLFNNKLRTVDTALTTHFFFNIISNLLFCTIQSTTYLIEIQYTVTTGCLALIFNIGHLVFLNIFLHLMKLS